MATRFDSKEYAKQRFLTLVSKYFPIDHLSINTSKRKGFKLADSTVALIQQSIDIVAYAEESKITIPVSTADIFRYGMVIINIFENLNQYQVISQLKSRSRRGYRKEIDVLEFDLKKIELVLKKSSSPPIKIQKDGKMIHEIKKYYLSVLEDSKCEKLSKDALKNQNLFVLSDSEGKKFHDSFLRLLNTLILRNSELSELQSHLSKIKTKNQELKNRISILEGDLSQLKKEVNSHREKMGILNHLDEKEKLLADPNLSLFLRIITICLERYIKMVERRENRKLDERDAYLGLVLEPTRFEGLTEELWREIVYIIETHGFDLIGSKNWFKFSNPEDLRSFIVQREVLEKFARLRKLERKLDEIESSLEEIPKYSSAKSLIQEYDAKSTEILELNGEIPEVREEIESLVQIVEEEKNKIKIFLN
ncbi:MAG: hypothetical protein ACXACU_11500 [Candidatus Hodarchaeales archaeon]|jgi:hypothetical protein